MSSYTLAIYPEFIKETKSLEGGILLSMLFNLWEREGDGFAATGARLADICCLSEREYKRAIQSVKDSWAFSVKLEGIPATNHFYANQAVIQKILQEI